MNKLLLKNYLFKLLLLVFIVVVSACNITKHVPDDKYLLNHNSLRLDGKKLNKKEINSLFRQKPNKRILGVRFHLGLYNFSNEENNSGFNRWLRKIGEEPVIYDEDLRERTTQQFSIYLKNKGFYNYSIKDTVKYKKKTAHVFYFIKTGEPFIIQSIYYRIEDSLISKLILKDSANCLLKSGSVLDLDQMQNERARIELYIRNKGYYNFTKDYINFEADSSLIDNTAKVAIVIRNTSIKNASGGFSYYPHSQYKLGNVNVYIEKERLIDTAGIYIPDVVADTLLYNGVCLNYLGRTKINPQFLINKIYLAPLQLYNQRNVEETYRSLFALKIFRTVNIVFSEDTLVDSSGLKTVNCKIQLSTIKPQSYQVEPELTNSSGRLGVAGIVGYQNKNLFKGAENFSFKLNIAVEAVRDIKDSVSYNPLKLKSTMEAGGEVKLQIPKFLLPFKGEQFIRKYNPSTSLSLSYRYMRRIRYIQSVANITFGYNWSGNRYTNFLISPFDINYVNITKEPGFDTLITTEYAKYAFSPHFVSTSVFSYTYNNQRPKKNYPFYYLRFNTESAGNALKAASNLINNQSNSNGQDSIFGVVFSQYIKGDIDMRYYQPVNETDRLVYRLFVGVGFPYGNSKTLPFERGYFSGGANSIRAWPALSLGPGSYKSTGIYPEMVSDIKLEANFEYRFKFFWKLELALFLDAGNIWSMNENDRRIGGLFEFDKFYKQLAVGSGLGTRLDVSFFIVRVDFGLKLREPSFNKNPWVFNRRSDDTRKFIDLVNPTLGIGYPF